MMIVSVTRNLGDVAAIRQSGVRVMLAPSLDDGVRVASRPDVGLIVCDLQCADAARATLTDRLRGTALPCPLLIRHDLSRDVIAGLYDIARLDGNVRSSFRGYDDLRDRLRSGACDGDGNATRAILRAFAPRDPMLRDFIGIMAVLGERPVMQARVARALGLSTTSFRKWLSEVRLGGVGVPRFPTVNAHFVALHFVWRRERLRWNGKHASVAGGFSDARTCANYFHYHLGKTGTQLLRAGGFDARMTAICTLLRERSVDRDEAIRRI